MFDDGDDFMPTDLFAPQPPDPDEADGVPFAAGQLGVQVQAGVLTVTTPRTYGKIMAEKGRDVQKPLAIEAGPGAKGGKAAEKAKDAPTFLKKLDKHDLKKTSEVTYGAGADAELTLKFGKTCGIRFFDDSGREHWRRALAYSLSRTEKPWARS